VIARAQRHGGNEKHRKRISENNVIYQSIANWRGNQRIMA
jgi:hypothetical protein